MKARNYALETGRRVAYASNTLQNRGQIENAFPVPFLDKWENYLQARAKILLHPSVEFITAVAFLCDAVIIFVSLCLGLWTGTYFARPARSFTVDFYSPSPYSIWFNGLTVSLMGMVFLLSLFAIYGLYSRKCFTVFGKAAKVIFVGSFFWLLARFLFGPVLGLSPMLLSMFSSFVCVSVVMTVWRYAFQKILSLKTLSANLFEKVVFVGWGKEAERMEEEMQRDRTQLYEVVGYVPSPQNGAETNSIYRAPTRVPKLGKYSDLPALLRHRRADVVMLADMNVTLEEITDLAKICQMEFAQFKVIPSYFPIFRSGLQLETISGVPVLGVSALPLDGLSNRLLKRAIDIVGAVVGLVIAFPFIAVFGTLVYLESPGPIFYRQVRTGKNGRPFKMIKIRSMRLDAEKDGKAQWCKEVDPRRLKIGGLMRRLNVDEVPQFWNVLKGEMSLVGPRPERPELIADFERKIPHYHARHACLPGITGWAQVNGWRGDTSLEERIRYDIWYVEHWSLGLDLKTMILTVFDSAMVRQAGAY